MDIKEFKVERWMNDFEDYAKYNLGETCVDSITVDELLDLANIDKAQFFEKVGNTRLSYSYIFGSPEFKKGVSELYENVDPAWVIPTHGATGANQLVIQALVASTDNMVSVMPTYQQHYSIPESIGADVRILKLKKEDSFLPQMDELRKMVDFNTKLIILNNPNNPTGSWIPKETMLQIVEIAKSVDAYILCDEVYRGLSEDGSYMYSIVDLYDKGISVGSMSKIFSMAGVRMGWVVSKDTFLKECVLKHRDYNTISCGVLDDILSAIAMEHKEAIFARNRKIVTTNRAVLDAWVKENDLVEYAKPVAGTTALVYYHIPMDSYTLCKRLILEKGLLFTPGSAFEEEHAVRIGYAYDTERLKDGLAVFSQFLKENQNV